MIHMSSENYFENKFEIYSIFHFKNTGSPLCMAACTPHLFAASIYAHNKLFLTDNLQGRNSKDKISETRH